MDPLTATLLLKIIDGIAFAAQYAPAMLNSIRAELTPLQAMIAEGRPPTDVEWARVTAKTDALTARLVTVAAEDADADR